MQCTIEIWKDVIGYEGKYKISNQGMVMSFCRYQSGVILRLANIQGYLLANIISKKVFVHRLVASHFIPNPENKPEVNHIDRNRENNNYCNLEWNTSRENVIHACRTLVRNPYQIITKETKLLIVGRYNLGEKIMPLSKEFSVTRSSVRRMIKKYSWHLVCKCGSL